MLGYKVFNSDWTCREFQYEVGDTFEYKGELKLCQSGFHFCRELVDCFKVGTYNIAPDIKIARVKALGTIIEGYDKCVTNKIKILYEIPLCAALEMINEGELCTGSDNSGNFNSGSHNTGHYNTGNNNSGDRNTGYFNVGCYNTGSYNIGDFNTGKHNYKHCNSGSFNNGSYNVGNFNDGNYNVGDFNIGKNNTGNFNQGSYNVGSFNVGNDNNGFFNTISAPVYVFNHFYNGSIEEIYYMEGIRTLIREYQIAFHELQTEQATKNFPENKEIYKRAWANMTLEDRQSIFEIPNFDKEVFKEITGIEII